MTDLGDARAIAPARWHDSMTTYQIYLRPREGATPRAPDHVPFTPLPIASLHIASGTYRDALDSLDWHDTPR